MIITCARVHLRGDYDRNGHYWGAGAPLWCVTHNDHQQHYRAGSKGVALQMYRREYNIEGVKAPKLYDCEYTDTFGGEANYGWCRRFIVSARTARGAVRLAKAHVGMGKADTDHYNDTWAVRPRGSCTILFVVEHNCERTPCAHAAHTIQANEIRNAKELSK